MGQGTRTHRGVLDEVGSPRLKACLDTGHRLLFSRESLERWFEVLGDRIVYLHPTDNSETRTPSSCSVPAWSTGPRSQSWPLAYAHEPLAVIETPTLERVRASSRFLQRERVYPSTAV